ncbi:MAG: hypothetical protein K2Y22_10355 [Candidatus Obscuribacterales bacterium]|nr:hypothetical protein [Candidatus Obscuribacterales bacterium]
MDRNVQSAVIGMATARYRTRFEWNIKINNVDQITEGDIVSFTTEFEANKFKEVSELFEIQKTLGESIFIGVKQGAKSLTIGGVISEIRKDGSDLKITLCVTQPQKKPTLRDLSL